MSSLLPGSTLGIIGGGQLARMMILEARRMGYRCAVLTEDADAPAASLADMWVEGELSDLAAAEKLARSCDVITLDTEHVPASMLSSLEQVGLVRPSASVLETIQDRRRQREFLESIDVPQPKCGPVSTLEELESQTARVGFPCVLKCRQSGYDGKGQAVIRDENQLRHAWTSIGEQPAMLEEFVSFECEISVLLARNPRGEIRFYPVALNKHADQVLRTTLAPAPVAPSVEVEAFDIAARIANALDHVGMMAVELFLVGDTTLLVNEIAPRPHNSGHYTFGGACATSQFEQHVRAVMDLPLGDTSLRKPVVMVNLFGDLWDGGEPDWTEVLKIPEAQLHLYCKREARPGRKMGHVLLLDEDPSRALHEGEALLERLHQSAVDRAQPRDQVAYLR